MAGTILPLHDRHETKPSSEYSRRFKSWRLKMRRNKRTYLAFHILVLLFIFNAYAKNIRTKRINNERIADPEFVVVDSDPTLFTETFSMDETYGTSVDYYDFNKISLLPDRTNIGGRLLLCIPLRNAESVLDMMFDHLYNLTYPHTLIDLAFLVGDSTDNTLDLLQEQAVILQNQWSSDKVFNKIDVFKHDFGATIGQGVDDRHGVHVQAERRKLMGRARNWLLSTTLKPYHSWVYWRDADIERSPASIIEDLMAFDKDVTVPNVWRPLPKWLGGQQPYDLNSWVESSEAIRLASTLDEDDVIVEGYAEYPTWRVHLAYLRSEEGSLDEFINLDGVGGVSILAKAKVFRSGANFPGFSFLSHAETEGFGKMCKKMGMSVIGLPHYTIWHQYEPSEDDLKKMKEMKAQGLPVD